MAVAIIDVNPIHAGFDAKVCVPHRGNDFSDLGRRSGEGLSVVKGEQGVALIFRDACISARRKHDAPRRIVLLDCAPCVWTDLNDQ